MKKLYVVTCKNISYLLDSRWGNTIKIGSKFTVTKEKGSFYKIKSPDIDDSTTLVSILKEDLKYAEQIEEVA